MSRGLGDVYKRQAEELREAIARHKPGDKLSLGIYRDGKKKSVTVTLGNAPEATK